MPAFGAPAAADEKGKTRDIKDILQANESCQNGTVDLLGTHGAAKSVKFQSLANNDVVRSLELYQACLSSIAGYEKSCTLLGGLKDGVKDCRDLADAGAAVSAVFSSGDTGVVCDLYSSPYVRDWLAKHGKTPNKEKSARSCAFFISAVRRGSTNVCSEARAAGLFPAPELFADCQTRLAFIDGVPDHCPIYKGVADGLCREKAALLAAVRLKNSHECALSPWCRALTGRRPESCDPYLVRANKAFCTAVAEVAIPVIKAKAAGEAKIQEMKAKQKPKFSKGAPMQVNTPEQLIKRAENKKTPAP